MTLRHLLALAWTLAILAACSIPGRDIPSVGLMQFDKVVHFCMFAGFGGLWLWALRGPLATRRWWVLGTGVGYAIGTEIYQGFLPFDRTPDPYDALANLAGLIAAIVLYQARTRWRVSESS